MEEIKKTDSGSDNFFGNPDTNLKSKYNNFSAFGSYKASLAQADRDMVQYKKSLRETVATLKELCTSDSITALGQQRLIIKIENELPEDSDWIGPKLAAEAEKDFQTEVNLAFDYPSDNPWQHTVLEVKGASFTDSKDKKYKKIRDTDKHIATVNHPTIAGTPTASCSGEREEDGTRIITVVSGQKAKVDSIAAAAYGAIARLPDNQFVEEQAEYLESIASGKEHSALSGEGLTKENLIHDFAYLYVSHAPDGNFQVTGAVHGNTTIIAFHPNNTMNRGFRTLPKQTDSSRVSEYLAEDSIVLCLTGEILDWLPKMPDKQSINFTKLFENGFTLPSKLTESTLITALANYATEQSEKNEVKTSRQFFIVGLGLSNELKTNPWLNPANVPAWLLALTVGVVFGLKLFAPVAFAAAAPTLMPLVFSFAALTGVFLLAYVAYGAFTDWHNQRKSGKLKLLPTIEIDDNSKKYTVKEPILGLAKIYFSRGIRRVWDWLTKQHPYQLAFGIVITLLMFTIASLALASLLNPLAFDGTVVGHALQAFFNFIAHTFSGLSQDTFLHFEVGSITSDIVVVLVTALIPTFLLNALRQAFTTGYEKWKDESLINDEPKGRGVDLTNMITDGSNASTLATNDFEDQNKNGHTSQLNQPKPFAAAQSDTPKITYAVTKQNWETMSNPKRAYRAILQITSPKNENGFYKAWVVTSHKGMMETVSVHESFLDKTLKVTKGRNKHDMEKLQAISGWPNEIQCVKTFYPHIRTTTSVIANPTYSVDKNSPMLPTPWDEDFENQNKNRGQTSQGT